MTKILVMTSGDKPIWEKELTSQLGGDYNSHEIRYVASNRTGPTAISVQTEIYKGIREARGDPEQLKREIGDAEILVISFEPITEDFLDKAPKLKLIASTRGGPVNVDAKAATKRGIIVTHTQGRLAQPVADHTIALMMAEARNIARQDAVLKDGSYFDPEKRDKIRASWRKVVEMEGKNMGIVGFGFVGRQVAARAKGFGMKVLAYDPYVPKELADKVGAKLVSLETLLQESHFVSINARESPETYHMMSTEQFKLMKPTSTIINTSRGSLIDEKALLAALINGEIAAAALDVYEDEPLKPDNPLLKLNNVTLTPHTAGASDLMRERSVYLTVELVKRYLKGGKITVNDVVDKDILEKIS